MRDFVKVCDVAPGSKMMKYKGRIFVVSPGDSLKELTSSGLVDVPVSFEVNQICTQWEPAVWQ